jgi:hypothetical protein
MKRIKQYFTGCNFCNATGFIQATSWCNYVYSTFMQTCPVCNGTKIVQVTETYETPGADVSDNDIYNHADRLGLSGTRHKYYCMGAQHMRDDVPNLSKIKDVDEALKEIKG